MGVGTSLGKNFDDLFHFHQNQYDSDKFPANDEEKSDIQRSVDNTVKGATAEMDEDLVRNPLEMSPGVEPPMAMLPEVMMKQKAFGNDPANIYNDSGDIVDFDLKNKEPLPLMKPMSLIQSESAFNEIDAQAEDPTLIHPIANITNTPGEIMEGLEGTRGANRGGENEYQMKFRLGQLLRDKASTKKAGGDVDSSDYMHYNTQIRDLRQRLKDLQ